MGARRRRHRLREGRHTGCRTATQLAGRHRPTVADLRLQRPGLGQHRQAVRGHVDGCRPDRGGGHRHPRHARSPGLLRPGDPRRPQRPRPGDPRRLVLRRPARRGRRHRQNVNVTADAYDEDAAIFAAQVAGAGRARDLRHAPRRPCGSASAATPTSTISSSPTPATALWAACDGGVFRSIFHDQNSAFVARNDGLAVVEANYVACHPTCEGRVVVGLQDNGLDRAALVGGVGATPATATAAGWRSTRSRPPATCASTSTGSGRRPTAARTTGCSPSARSPRRSPSTPTPPPSATTPAFYSTPAAIAHNRGGAARPTHTQVLIGTTRVWYTEDWANTWVTLPTGTDPIGATNFNRKPGPPRRADHGVQVGDVRRRLDPQRQQAGADGARRAAATWPPRPARGAATRSSTAARRTRRTTRRPKDRSATRWCGPTSNRTSTVPATITAPKGIRLPGHRRRPRGRRGRHAVVVRRRPDTGTRTRAARRGLGTGHGDPLRPGQPERRVRGHHRGRVARRARLSVTPPTWDWRTARQRAARGGGGGPRPVRQRRPAPAAGGDRCPGRVGARLDTPVADVTYLRAHDDDLRYRIPGDGHPARWCDRPLVARQPRRAAAHHPRRRAPAPGPACCDGVRRPVPPRTCAASRRRSARRPATTGSGPTGEWDLYFEDVLRDHRLRRIPSSGKMTIDTTFWNSMMSSARRRRRTVGNGRPARPDPDRGRPPRADTEARRGRRRARCRWSSRRSRTRSTSLSITGASSPASDPTCGSRCSAGRDGRPTRSLAVTTRARGSPATSRGRPPSTRSSTRPAAPRHSRSPAPAGRSSAPTPPPGARPSPIRISTTSKSGVATFDLDLSPFRNNTVMLLVAIIRAGGNSAVATDTLENLAMTDPHIAVRSLVIEKP